MKKISYIIISIILVNINIDILAQDDLRKAIAENPSNARKRFEWFYSQRAYPNDTIEQGYLLRAWEKVKDYPVENTTKLSWQNIGPQPGTYYSYGNIGGRIPALVVHPSNNSIVYIGAADGGVWKTTNGGTNWIFMTNDLPTLASGSLAIDKNNPETIYWGTGEPYYSGDAYGGAGVFKTTNGGSSWTSVGLTSEKRIPALVIDPTNGNILIAATWNGIYRTTNGGTTWINTLSYARGYDVVIHPTNSLILYAGIGDHSTEAGIYKSTNNGINWTKLTSGLPESSQINRMKIAIAPSSPSTVYALMSSKNPFGGMLGLYKSTNDGSTWNEVTSAPSNLFNSQGWYDIMIGIHPTNPNIVFIGGINVYRTTNGGTSWSNVSGSNVHVDQHSIGFGNNIVYIGNDGGVWKSTDNGSNWTNLNSSLAVTQFYAVGLDKLTPNRVYGGTQDNGTQRTVGAMNWTGVNSGDGGMVVVDHSNSNIVYAESQNGYMVKSTNGGTSFSFLYNVSGAWVTPIRMHPTSSNIIYTANKRVLRSTNSGSSFSNFSDSLNSSNIQWLTIHPTNPNVVYAASSSKLFKTSNNGSSWSNITGTLPNRTITQVVVDPIVSTTVYVTFSGTGGSHVYKSTNEGTTWVSINGDLPDVPANALVVHPGNSNTIYIGTDLGLFVTTNGGTNWLKETGIPNVAVIDMGLTSDNYLVAATHGRSMYKALINTAPTISVTSPNGGETWAIGTTKTIQWNSGSVSGNVKIEISRNGGSSFEVLFSNTANDGTENWTVSGSVTSSAKIKVTSIDNSTVFDLSDANFTIVQPTIAVTSPNGGEVWQIGSYKTIQWTTSNLTGNVKIELSRNGGSTFETLFANTGNDGSESWLVTGITTTNARIRISSIDIPLLNDLNDASFSIVQPTITVSSPNGGNIWSLGTSQNIQWNSSYLTGNVKIELSRNGGSTYEVLFSNTPNDGIESWIISGTVTSSARIRITSLDFSAVNDISDANFSIVQPTVTVVSPNGGESWTIGTQKTIEWNSTYLSGNVKIELSRNGGNTYQILYASTPNDGSENWTVEGPVTNAAMIKVTSIDLPSISDVSNSQFSINLKEISLITPIGNELWGIGRNSDIKWSSVNMQGNVKIELSRNGGSSYETIFANIPNNGVKSWTITPPASTQAKMRISSIETPVDIDSSNNIFIIAPSLKFVTQLEFSNNINETKTIEFGSAGDASDVIDVSLGEYELPPIPPINNFDVRWQIPGTLGALRDIRDTLKDNKFQIVYKCLIQPGSGGYPILIRWNTNDLPEESIFIRDGLTNGAKIFMNMKSRDSLLINDQDISTFHIIYSSSYLSSTMSAGWNLVSLPMVVQDSRTNVIFPMATSNAHTYKNGSYLKRDTLNFGEGNWLKFSSVIDVPIQGKLIDNDTIYVNTGWNMIGSISFSVSTGNIIQIPDNIIASNFYGYHFPSYFITNTLEPVKGYWIKVNQPGKLILVRSTGKK